MALEFTKEELAAYRTEFCGGFTDSQFDLAMAIAKRRELIPGQHIFFQIRNGSEWNSDIGAKVKTQKLITITTIDGFRLISQRTNEYAGQGKGKFYYLDATGNPTIVSEIPLPDPENPRIAREPWAASIPIYRKGFVEPVEVVCRFDAYAVTYNKGNTVQLTDMWLRRGPEQLLKCSEAASRRAAFPEELGTLYLAEEFAKEDAEPPTPKVETPVTEVQKPRAVPEMNHEPATPTDAPRPEDKPKKSVPVKSATVKDVLIDKAELVGGVSEPPVQKTDKIETNETPAPTRNERIKALTAFIDKSDLKNYIIRQTGKEDYKAVTEQEWDLFLGQVESVVKNKSKDAAVEFVKTAKKTDF